LQLTAPPARSRREQRSVVALRSMEFNTASESPQLKRGSLGSNDRCRAAF